MKYSDLHLALAEACGVAVIRTVTQRDVSKAVANFTHPLYRNVAERARGTASDVHRFVEVPLYDIEVDMSLVVARAVAGEVTL